MIKFFSSSSPIAIPPAYATCASDPLIWQQVTLCALNAIYLVGKCFPSIPPIVPQFAHTARCFYAVCNLEFSRAMCVKSFEDTKVVLKAKQWSVLPWVLVSLFVNTSSLFLSIASFATAASTTFSSSKFAERTFAILGPLGNITFLMGFFRDVLSLLPDQQILDTLASTKKLPPVKSSSYLYLRARLDPWSFKEWSQLSAKQKPQEMIIRLKAVSFYTQINNVQAALFLPANWLMKRYPNSILEGAIRLSFSLSYLWNQVFRRKREATHS